MELSSKEMELIQELGVKVHGNTAYYNGLTMGFDDFENILILIEEDALELRKENKLKKETYRECKQLIHERIMKTKREEEKEKFLKEPKQEVENQLENKNGIKEAKISNGRVLVIFEDGEELDIHYKDHYGLQISLGERIYTDPNGL